MLLNILVVLKTILYVNITEIKYNKILVFLLTALISIVILELIQRSKTEHKDKIRIIFYSILSIIMFVDVIYYIQFSTLPSVVLLRQVDQLSAVGDSVLYLLNIKNLLLILDIPIVILFYSGYKARLKKRDFNIKDITLKVSASLLAISLLGVVLLDKTDSVRSQELYSYHLMDIVETLLKREEKNILSKSDLAELKNRTELAEGKYTGIGKDKNLIVVQVEALQNFVVGLEYEGQEVTPEINKLIGDKSSVYYDNYYQLVGRGNTSDAEFVSHNSLHPSMEEHSYSRFEKNDFYGLPVLLRDNGYKTIAMHGNDGEYWNRKNAYVNQGFDEFLDLEFYEVEELVGLGVSDKDFFLQNVEYLKDYKSKAENPFYAFMATLTSHTPYNMPERYKTLRVREEHKDTILGNYLQSINYADRQIGLLIEELRKSGLYEDTVIALYGDHYAISLTNEEDRNIMSDFFGYEYDYDEMMNIPLVVHIPGEEIKETISKVGSQLDFYPTILNFMGYKNEKGLIFGRDLSNYEEYNFVAPQTYMRKGSFIDDDITFVISRDGIFDHSRAYEKQSKEKIEELDSLRLTHEKAIREINRSDYILNHNLLKEYIETGGNIDLDNFKGESELDVMDIYDLERNTLEELEEVYNSGMRIIAVDLELTQDDKVVLLKDWTREKRLKLEEFKSVEREKGETALSLEDLGKWLITHRDVKIVLKSERDEVEVLVKAYDSSDLEEGVAMISDFASYLEITNNRYREVILDPSVREYKSKAVMDFIDRYPSIGMLIDEEIEKNKLKELSGKGIDIYKYKN